MFYNIALILSAALLIIFDIVWFLIIARVILSWFPNVLGGVPFSFVHFVTEPFIAPVRFFVQKLPINTGMFDFSPMLTLLLMRFLSILLRVII